MTPTDPRGLGGNEARHKPKRSKCSQKAPDEDFTHLTGPFNHLLTEVSPREVSAACSQSNLKAVIKGLAEASFVEGPVVSGRSEGAPGLAGLP